jgi:hypothetical protein
VKTGVIRHAVTETAVAKVTRTVAPAPEGEFGAKFLTMPAECFAVTAESVRSVVF